MVEYNLAAVQRFCIHPRKQSVRTRAYAAHPSQAYDMKQPSNDQSATPKATLLLSRPITMSLHCRLVGNACSRAREFFTTVTRYALRKKFVSASIPGTYLKNAKIASILDFHVIIRRTRRRKSIQFSPDQKFFTPCKAFHSRFSRQKNFLPLFKRRNATLANWPCVMPGRKCNSSIGTYKTRIVPRCTSSVPRNERFLRRLSTPHSPGNRPRFIPINRIPKLISPFCHNFFDTRSRNCETSVTQNSLRSKKASRLIRYNHA